jgi:hypothetical protein
VVRAGRLADRGDSALPPGGPVRRIAGEARARSLATPSAAPVCRPAGGGAALDLPPDRRRWDDYQKAFSEMLSATSTEWAPWYVISADRKWFARICAAAVLVHTLIEIDPQYPTVSEDTRRELARIKLELEEEAPKGALANPYATADQDRERARPNKNKAGAKKKAPAS